MNGLRDLQNGEVFEKTNELDRILLTYDRDFLWITKGIHPGVVIIKIHPNISKIVIPHLTKFIKNISQFEIPNHLIIIEKDKVITHKTN